MHVLQVFWGGCSVSLATSKDNLLLNFHVRKCKVGADDPVDPTPCRSFCAAVCGHVAGQGAG
jgi:hypothetical protein